MFELMSHQVLIIAAHPDDEVLGCGGTIAKMSDEGAIVHVAFLADGVFSRTGARALQAEELKIRRKTAKNACDLLGVSTVFFGDFPDNCMDTVALLEIAKAVESLITEYQPETLFTHHVVDDQY